MTIAWPSVDLLPGSRVDLFTYTITDSGLNPSGEVHPVVTEDGGTAAPRIRSSIQGNALRVLDGVQLIPDEATLDPRVDRLAPSWVDTDGTPYPLGVYRLVDASVVQFSGGDHIDASFADESSVHHSPTTRAMSWPKGYECAAIIDQLAGILNVPFTDADPTTEVLGQNLVFPAGSTDWYDVYSKVAGAAGFLVPYFDLSGVWRWRTAPDWETVEPDHVWSTDPTAPLDQQRVVQQSSTRSVTLFDSPNVFYVVNTAAKGAPIRGRYQLPASAPNSVERTGAVVAQWEENAAVNSQQAADAAARALSIGSLDDVGEGSVKIPLDPRVDVYDSVLLDGLLYRVVGWNCRLAPGDPMTHDLRRVFRTSDPEAAYFGGTI